MRLIDADALLYDLEIAPLTDDGGVDINDLEEIIKRQPTVEAVYLCNRRKCDHCDPECDFTRDIDYAVTTDKVIIVDGAAYAVKGKPEGRWIPVTERLPEVKPECYYADSTCELYESDPVIVCAEHAEPYSVGIATMVLDKTDGQMEWSGYVGDFCASSCNIVAWMPLPEPYKGERK